MSAAQIVWDFIDNLNHSLLIFMFLTSNPLPDTEQHLINVYGIEEYQE